MLGCSVNGRAVAGEGIQTQQGGAAGCLVLWRDQGCARTAGELGWAASCAAKEEAACHQGGAAGGVSQLLAGFGLRLGEEVQPKERKKGESHGEFDHGFGACVGCCYAPGQRLLVRKGRRLTRLLLLPPTGEEKAAWVWGVRLCIGEEK